MGVASKLMHSQGQLQVKPLHDLWVLLITAFEICPLTDICTWENLWDHWSKVASTWIMTVGGLLGHHYRTHPYLPGLCHRACLPPFPDLWW